MYKIKFILVRKIGFIY